MDTLQVVIGKRESEFTGLKGQLLRYLGAAFFLTVFGLLIVAAGERHTAISTMTGRLSDVFFACALALYPFVTCLSHLSRMTREYRAGGEFRLAGAVLALYGREGAARAEAENAAELEGADLAAAMREEGSAAVLTRFGRERTFAMCRAVYVTVIAVSAAAFVAMLAVAPF